LQVGVLLVAQTPPSPSCWLQMEVRYDARAEASSKDAALPEWVKTYPKLEEALHTISLRFVINLPEESLRNAPRLCFELQEAFWFYLDYLYDNAKKELPKLNQMNFVHLMLEACDVLRAIYVTSQQRQRLLQDWREYCKKVPLKGAVLLNQKMDKCLMVQPWKGDKWTYPRGKINEDESEMECAVREVWEETGLDITGLVDEHAFVQADVYGFGVQVKLFLVLGIAEEVACAPNTRKEISKIGWVELCRLPGWDCWDEPDPEDGLANLRFLAVAEFVPEIQRWVQDHRAWGDTAARSAKQRPLPPSRRQPSRSPPPRKRESGSSRPRPEVRQPVAELPIPPPPAAEGSRSPSGGDTPKSRFEQNGGRGRAAPKRLPKSTEDRSSCFSLDLSRVMREFDHGWESVRPNRGV